VRDVFNAFGVSDVYMCAVCVCLCSAGVCVSSPS